MENERESRRGKPRRLSRCFITDMSCCEEFQLVVKLTGINGNIIQWIDLCKCINMKRGAACLIRFLNLIVFFRNLLQFAIGQFKKILFCTRSWCIKNLRHTDRRRFGQSLGYDVEREKSKGI